MTNPISAIVQGGSTIAGGILSSKAAKKGANAQNRAADAQIAESRRQYDQTRADQQPFYQTGVASNERLAYLMGLTPASGGATGTAAPNNDPNFGSLAKRFGAADYQADPGYDFRLSQGQKALERSQAAKGGLFSGAAGKEITEYAQGQASQEYGNAYNRYNNNQSNLYNRLSGLSGGGQTAAGVISTAGQNTATAVNSAYAAKGNANQDRALASGAAWTTGLNNIAKGYGAGNANSPNQSTDAANYYNPGTYNPVAANNGLPWSDVRLKKDIKFLAVENGHNMYEFSYNWHPQRYIGVLAHEVTHVKDAVKRIGEYFAVDYSKLGVKFAEVSHG